MTVKLEVKKQDCWIGVYWETKKFPSGLVNHDVWVCIIPMLPIHIHWYSGVRNDR